MSGSVGHRLDGLKTRRVAAGLTVADLAKRATVTDYFIQWLEDGGNCMPYESDRILAAMGGPPSVAVTSSANGNPATITVAGNSWQTGDVITISGHTGSNPAIDGARSITRVNSTSFTIPVNVTSPGTGGTAVLELGSLGLARL